jgi:hypothetical protein
MHLQRLAQTLLRLDVPVEQVSIVTRGKAPDRSHAA